MTDFESQTNQPADPSMNSSASDAQTQTVPMVLISDAQRNALIEYLAKQPYQDVAAGIAFLREAPMVNVNISLDGDGQDAARVEEGSPS